MQAASEQISRPGIPSGGFGEQKTGKRWPEVPTRLSTISWRLSHKTAAPSVRVLLLVPPAADVHVENGAGLVVLEGREVDLDHDLVLVLRPCEGQMGPSP